MIVFAHMGAVFKYLHEQNVTKKDLEECLASIPLTQGMEVCVAAPSPVTR